MIDNLEQVITKLNNYNLQGRYAEVMAELVNYISQDESEASLYVLRGNAQYGLGQLEEAAESYATACVLNPLYAGARANYASALYALGSYLDSVNACEAALYADDTFVPAYINAAHCYAAMGHMDHAVYNLQRAMEVASDDAETGATVADMLSEFGEYEMARDAYFKVAVLQGAPANIHERIANFFKTAKDNGIERTRVLTDVEDWRRRFVKNQDVFRLASTIM